MLKVEFYIGLALPSEVDVVLRTSDITGKVITIKGSPPCLLCFGFRQILGSQHLGSMRVLKKNALLRP